MMIKIVPNQDAGGNCQSTILITESGEVISGVRRIELIAEPGSIWRARVDIDVTVAGPIVAELIAASQA